MDVLWLNDEDTSDLGLGVVSLVGWYDLAPVEYGFAFPVGRRSGIVTGSPEAGPRRVVIELAMMGLARGERVPALDVVVARLSGAVEVRVGDADRVATGVATCRVAGAWGNDRKLWQSGEMVLALDIDCPDALKYSRSWGTLGMEDGVPVSVPTGTAGALGIVTIHGAVDAAVTLTARRHGVTVGEMGLLLDIGGDDAVEVDLVHQTIVQVTDGVRTAGESLLTSGWFFGIGPDTELTLENADGSLEHRGAWLS
jgi:hypothetical protein